MLTRTQFYFYDNGMVQGDEGIKLENLVACALLKHVHRTQDEDGADVSLHCIRNKDGQEVDFLLNRDERPHHLIEVKWRVDRLSPTLKKSLAQAPISRTQVVGELAQSKSYPSGERIEPAIDFLSGLV